MRAPLLHLQQTRSLQPAWPGLLSFHESQPIRATGAQTRIVRTCSAIPLVCFSACCGGSHLFREKQLLGSVAGRWSDTNQVHRSESASQTTSGRYFFWRICLLWRILTSKSFRILHVYAHSSLVVEGQPGSWRRPSFARRSCSCTRNPGNGCVSQFLKPSDMHHVNMVFNSSFVSFAL